LQDAEEKDDSTLPRTKVTVTLSRVGPRDGADIRQVEWLVDGATYKVKMEDPPAGKVKYGGPMANSSNKNHVACPLPGVIGNIMAKEGQEMSKGDKMFTIVAMKMEVHVEAPFDCTVGDISVTKDLEVVDGALLATVKPRN